MGLVELPDFLSTSHSASVLFTISIRSPVSLVAAPRTKVEEGSDWEISGDRHDLVLTAMPVCMKSRRERS